MNRSIIIYVFLNEKHVIICWKSLPFPLVFSLLFSAPYIFIFIERHEISQTVMNSGGALRKVSMIHLWKRH